MAKFYSVGVGAGNSDYITLGALRALEKSDVIAVPVKKHGEKSTAFEIIKNVFDTTKKEILFLEFPMSRNASVLGQSHKEAAKKIIRTLSEGKTVSMITLGDVSVYSTCSYMLRLVRDTGFEAEIIAGVPSFCAAADKALVSLCEGDETVAIVPSPDTEKLEKYLDDFDTVVIMKAGKNIGDIHNLLLKHGLCDNAVVCGNIGMENEIVGKINPDNSYGYFTTVIIKKTPRSR